jgi:hypothetical protein
MAAATHSSQRPNEPVPWLVRLYPPSWRDRYGAEFGELLLARPPSGRDRLDIIRSAIDARVHPQITEERPPRVAGAGDHLLAVAAVAVGVLFSTWAGIIVSASPRWGAQGSASNDFLAASYAAGLVGALLAAAVLAGLAYRHIDALGSAGALGAVVAALGFLSFLGEAGVFGVVLLSLGTLALAPGLATVVRWPVAAALVAATLFLAAAMLGFVGSGGQELLWLWLMAVYGPSWMLLGVSLRRGRRAPVASVSVAA